MTTCTASDLAHEYGCTPRYWKRLAAKGKIPGTRQLAGPKGKWLFDRDKFRQWWQGQERKQCPEYTAGARPIGYAFNVTVGNTVAASRQRTEKLLNDALGRT
jgi:hypothetical protein